MTQVCASTSSEPGQAGPSADATVSGAAAPTAVAMAPIHHGGRDVALPDYLADYSDAQISSGCRCLLATNAVTVTNVAAATSTSIVQVRIGLPVREGSERYAD